MAKIYDIQSIPKELLPQVGGKARGLHELIRLGYQVPRAFIITDIDDDESYDEAVEKYLIEGMGDVSVRSSATLEDGTDFSAAGQFATLLNVCGAEALREAARQCRASLHSVTAQHYASTFLRDAESRMTIVVQQMVRAKCAGVIFSRAPMRPGFALVEAVPGLGENLVSGRMSAQQYRVRDNKVEQMPQHPILTHKEAVALGSAGRRAEELFGMPMDLEWAIDEQGTIQWLQARPITISESVTANELDCDLDASSYVYTTGNIGEVMPGAVTPLNLSTNVFALDWGVRQTYIEIGCSDDSLPPYSYLAPYYNHVFFNMTNLYRVNHATFGTTKETTDESICGMVLEGMPADDMSDLPTWQRLRNTVRFARIVFNGEKAKRGMDEVVAGLKFDLTQDMHGIYRQITGQFQALNLAQYYHYRASYYSGGQSALLHKLVKDFADPDAFKALVAGCLTQNEEFESANILRMMSMLAERIVQHCPEAVHYETEQLAEYLERHANHEVQEAYDEFMMRHGFRGLHETEIMSLPWRDNPTSFYASLRSVLATTHHDTGRGEKPWTAYADELCAHYSGLKSHYVRSLIQKARKGVCYREYTKSRTIFVLDQFRQAYRRLAALMTEAALLPDTQCIFFLKQEEVGRLLAGEQSLVKKAMARRRIFPLQQQLKFPYAQLGVPQPMMEPEPDGRTVSIQGRPVSRGIATGLARVVNSEADAVALQQGEIMVTHCTDIGWSPYYSIIAGLVTEIGSALSHGVVVAREYALPTVVNASNAMALIQTGDLITIDGNTGRVTINQRKKRI